MWFNRQLNLISTIDSMSLTPPFEKGRLGGIALLRLVHTETTPELIPPQSLPTSLFQREGLSLVVKQFSVRVTFRKIFNAVTISHLTADIFKYLCPKMAANARVYP